MKWMIFFIILQKNKLFGTWKFGKIDVLINFNFFPQFSQFFLWEVNLRGLRAFILQNVQGSVVETEKKVLLPITQLGKEETLIILLSAWDRSRDSTQKRNLSKHMWRTSGGSGGTFFSENQSQRRILETSKKKCQGQELLLVSLIHPLKEIGFSCQIVLTKQIFPKICSGYVQNSPQPHS